MRVCLLVDCEPRQAMASPVVRDLAGDLERHGCSVDALSPIAGPVDINRLVVDFDVYIPKYSSEGLLSISGVLHDRGAILINSFAAASRLRDKARATATLWAAGLPVPATLLAADARAAWQGLGGQPMIVKPIRGTNGEGIRVFPDARALSQADTGLQFAQTFDRIVPHADLKVYVIGGEVFTVRRPWPATTRRDKLGELCHMGPEFGAMARSVGRLFGLEVYGIDVVETELGYAIVDVNACPGLVGVPDAGRRWASHVLGRMRRGARAWRSRPEPAMMQAGE